MAMADTIPRSMFATMNTASFVAMVSSLIVDTMKNAGPSQYNVV